MRVQAVEFKLTRCSMPRDYGRDMFVQGCGNEGTAYFDKIPLPLGCRLFPQFLDASVQQSLLRDVRSIIADAPFFTPHMPKSGKPFSVATTNCGELGWVSDKDRGYRYEPLHPATGRPWPPIPKLLTEIWLQTTKFDRSPQACLVNYYAKKSRLGLHRDEDEVDFSAPILSISLGDSAIFRIGGLKRRDPVQSIELHSGDAFVMSGPSRLRYHGIGRICAGTSTLLDEGGRLNLTLRYVGGAA